MTSEQFSADQSLKLIDSMINKAKNQFSERGILYLLWGWVIFICAIGHFVLLQLDMFEHPEIIWASCWLVVIFQIFYLLRVKRKETVRTYSAEIIGYVWMAFGAAIFLAGFIMSRANLFEYMYSLFLVLYGIPTFLSGVIMRFTPLKIGGISCWVLSLLSVFISSEYTLLLLAAAVAISWIIPGYMLSAKYKKQNS
jgi:hypothetical protein